jgi:ubiquinone/menaquinone biosynthesis C-methylase UbiE
MPSMYEIYERYSHQYDELVSHEDYQHNLKQLLFSLVDWKNKIVVEAGIGTGRVTSIYIDVVKHVYGIDRSSHMLEKLKSNLSTRLNLIDLYSADNLHLPELPEKADIFIEGWSFGHTISDNETELVTVTDILVNHARRMTKDTGKILFIETLGSNSKIPKAPKESLASFFRLLENKYGFRCHKIRTDYKFSTNADAARITGFFFGDKFGEEVLQSGRSIVPEWTGVWELDKAG